MDFFRSRLDPRAPIRLSRIVQEFDPQLVHLHGGRAAFFAALASPKAPTIYSVHGYHFLHKNTVMRRLALSAERLAARRAKEIVFVSRYDASVAEDYKIASATGRRTIILNSVPLPEGSGPMRTPDTSGSLAVWNTRKTSLFLDVMEKLPEYHATMIGGHSRSGGES